MKKIYISADIEGVATTLRWKDCDPGDSTDYQRARKQMTLEVAAACEGAIAAGVEQIVVKDAHDCGCNLLPELLPKGITLKSGWSGHPYNMVEGIDSSYDACLFVGYHGAAASDGNPLSHTWSSSSICRVTMNGAPASEFRLFSFCAASEKVPVVYLSGDAAVCKDAESICPGIVTTAVKSGWGGSITALHPEDACDWIRSDVERALSRQLISELIQLPEHFSIEIEYFSHINAEKASYYSGAIRLTSRSVGYETDNYFELMRFLRFTI